MRTTPASWSTSMETAPERFITSWMFLPPFADEDPSGSVVGCGDDLLLDLQHVPRLSEPPRGRYRRCARRTPPCPRPPCRSCTAPAPSGSCCPWAPTTIPMNLGSTSNSTLRPRSSSSCTLARSWSSFSLMDNRCCSTIRALQDGLHPAAPRGQPPRADRRGGRFDPRRASSKVTSPMPTAAPWMSSIPSGECAHCTSEDGREKSRDSA